MDVLNQIEKDLTPLLKECGFTKNGSRFYLINGNNCGVIAFQKSRSSSKDLVLFTLNFGVYSKLLGEEADWFENLVYPKVEQCQWIARIGDFMPGRPDYWWQIETTSNKAKNITGLIFEKIKTLVIPEIKKRLTDEGLIESWINGEFMDTTAYMQFVYTTTFLKIKNEGDKLKDVIKDFLSKSKGRPNERYALEHLKELNIKTDY